METCGYLGASLEEFLGSQQFLQIIVNVSYRPEAHLLSPRGQPWVEIMPATASTNPPVPFPAYAFEQPHANGPRDSQQPAHVLTKGHHRHGQKH
ncbi:5806_t:CDS:2, partial [Acaulospora colombiana]